MSVGLPVDAGMLNEKDRAEVIAWVSSLGIDPHEVRPYISIRRTEAGGYELRLARMIRDEQGKPTIDRLRDQVVTTPFVIDLGAERTWPKALDSCAPPAPSTPC